MKEKFFDAMFAVLLLICFVLVGLMLTGVIKPKATLPDLPECAGSWRQAGFAGFVKGDTVQFSPMFECVVPEVQQGPKGKRNGLSIL